MEMIVIRNRRAFEGWDGNIRAKVGCPSEGASIADPMVAHDLLLGMKREGEPRFEVVLAFPLHVDLVWEPT